MATWRPPKWYPRFLDKTNFLRILTSGPGTYRTLLQSPHSPVPELYPTLPWCTASGGSRHMSPVPVFPWGSIKRIFPGYPHPVVQRGHQYPQLVLGHVPELRHRGRLPGVRSTFSYLVNPLILYPRHLDKTKLSRILTPRAQYQQDPSIIPQMVRSLNVGLGYPAHVSGALLPTWGLIKRNFPRYYPPLMG